MRVVRGILGATRPGTDEHGVGGEGLDVVQREGVAAVHDGLSSQFPEVLDEVVDERVVVVDDQDPGCHGAHVTAARSDPGLRFV